MSLGRAKDDAPYTVGEGRRFGLLVGGMLVALAVITIWRGGSTSRAEFLGAVGTLLVLVGATVPLRLRPVYRAWMGLAQVLSRITTPVFMGIVYFVVITPIAFVRRALRGSPLVARVGADGYWAVREPGKHGDMERQF